MRCCTAVSKLRRAVTSVVAACAVVGLAEPAHAEGAGVHGRVLGLDEHGKFAGVVSGATIQFMDQTGKVVARITVGSNGYYRAQLPPGKYYYRVTADGFKDQDQGRAIALELSDEYAVYNFSLTKGNNEKRPAQIPAVPLGSLGGRVLEKTASGQLVGVPRAIIMLRRSGTRELTRVVARRRDKQGDNAGRYQVNLEVGSWRSSVAAVGFETLVDPKSIRIEPGKAGRRNFVLSRSEPEEPKGQGINGVIRLLASERTAPADSDIKVWIIPALAPKDTGEPITPESQGKYSRALAAGRYRVVATAKGYRTARSRLETVLPGRYSVADLTLVPITSGGAELVFVATVYERHAQGVRPLAGASVLIRKSDQSLRDAPRGTTDGQGRVRLNVSSAGSYVLLAQKSGFKPFGSRFELRSDGENSARITLEPETLRPPPVRPPTNQPNTITVSGYVVYRSASSRTGYYGVPRTSMVWRRIDSAGSQVQISSAELGRFSLTLPEGNYLVELAAPGRFASKSERVVVRQGMVARHFVLEQLIEPPATPPPSRLVAIQGYVVTKSAASSTGYVGVPDVEIAWAAQGSPQLHRLGSDRAGRFTVALEPGSYTVDLKAPPGFQSTRQVIDVRPGMNSPIIALARTTVPTQPVPPLPLPDEPVSPTAGRPVALNLRILQRLAASSVPRLSPLRQAPRIGSLQSAVPVAQAQVVINRRDRAVAKGLSDQAGRYSVRLRPGVYDISVSRRGYTTARQRVTVRGDLAQDIYLTRLTIRTQLPLTLRVLERVAVTTRRAAASVPVSGARITLSRNGSTVSTVRTDKSGQYVFRLAPGTYRVIVAKQGYTRVRESVTLSTAGVSRTMFLTRTNAPLRQRSIRGILNSGEIRLRP